MKTKLTLRMDEDLIAAAKAEAGQHGVSVSQMVANFFKGLRVRKKDARMTVGRATSQLLGMARGARWDGNSHREYLSRKHS